MSALSKAVYEMRTDAQLKQKDVAQHLGISQAGYSRKESGDIAFSPADRKKLAELFNMTLDQFDEKWRASSRTSHVTDNGDMIPVLNRGPAGLVYDYEETHANSGVASEFIDRGDIKEKHVFAIIVTGESMEPALRDGDYIVFRPVHKYREIKIEPGTIVCVRVVDDAGHDQGVTIARYFAEGNLIKLQKDNPKFAQVIVQPERVTQLSVFVELRMSVLLYYAAFVLAMQAIDGAVASFEGPLLYRPSWDEAPTHAFCCHTAWLLALGLFVGGFFLRPWWGILAALPANLVVHALLLQSVPRAVKVIPCWFLSIFCFAGWLLTRGS